MDELAPDFPQKKNAGGFWQVRQRFRRSVWSDHRQSFANLPFRARNTPRLSDVR
jgi:hypothetical protein